MKNLVLALFLSVLVAACSSGNTISDVPQNVTSTFSGTFQGGAGTSGSLTLNLSDNNAGVVTGNILVSGNTCLQSGTFTSGVSNGFNLTINDIPQAGVDMFQVVTTTTGPGTPAIPAVGDAPAVPAVAGTVSISTVIVSSGTLGTQQSTLGDGTVIETVTTAAGGEDGTLNLQLAINDGGSMLSGTFVAIGPVCPAGQGSGGIVLNGG